ncbi:hypothetical protein PMIN01_03508 [Paraphaeosphaeria minitans]|uniref:Uncharacterized protein n=1 Tax=Paraphaeosphaeria minitans TaxID=565426 RepID=A0A9P6GNI7_9PLEO|nr:hypothetical protein PMIN01_03508 [Paraphaeosphaeria minitans]
MQSIQPASGCFCSRTSVLSSPS